MDYTHALALVGLSGLLAGLGLGILLMYLVAVRGLISSLNRLRYLGWTVDRPIERPKTVPVPELEGEDYL